MADIVEFPIKTAASKARVAAMAQETVGNLLRAQKAAEDAAEQERIRRMVCLELGLAIQKMYALLEEDEVDRLIPWVISAKREDHRRRSRGEK